MANQYDTNLKLQAIADAIGDTQSSGLISALEDIADAVAGGGGGGSSAAGLVSDNFSETDTYDMGDYCIHNNTLYVCINAINTPGPWDLSDWQATNAGIQLSSLNSALAVHTDTVNGVVFSRQGNIVSIYGYGIDPTNLPTVPAIYRPNGTMIFPVTAIASSKLYNAYVGITSSGGMNCNYSTTYAGAPGALMGGSIYFTISYVVN